MPELPDVEADARRVREQGLKRPIARVDLRDPERLRGASTADLEAALTGYAFEAARRHGKVLFLEVSCGWRLVLHFGMTGFLRLYQDPGEAPPHARLVLDFADGGHLAFDDLRKLGWLELTDDIRAYLHSQGIGPDALDFDLDALRAYFAAKRGMVKTALTDQARIAGIGNVYADEILFQTGIRPDRKVEELTGTDVEAIHAKLHDVLDAAVRCGAAPDRMPAGWLTPHRGTDAPCPRCGGALATPKVGGRTAYVCPRCQA